MELLYSSVKPVRLQNVPTFRDAFERQFLPADQVKIATGYVSEDSLLELQSILAQTNTGKEKKRCDLIIGMHGREGFTRPQYDAALSLGRYLRDQEIGEVRVCTAFKFHGKVYSFLRKGHPQAAIVGSSNLSGLMGNELQAETDLLMTKPSEIQPFLRLHQSLAGENATKSIFEHHPTFIERQGLLEGVVGVEPVSHDDLKMIQRNVTGVSFEIPLKTEAKSNLNAYFGKGRKAPGSGAVRPRAWYEAELIVPKAVTTLPGYPAAKVPFFAFTDDGWKFRCKVSGDFGKNLRSEDDLQTLGRWIKGRMERAGALTAGQPVTASMLKRYGRDTVTLRATADPGVWYLDFSPGV